MKNQIVLIVKEPICGSLAIISKIIDSTNGEIIFTTPQNVKTRITELTSLPIKNRELISLDIPIIKTESKIHQAPSYHKLGKHRR